MKSEQKTYQPPEFAGDIRLQLSRNESRPSINVASSLSRLSEDGVSRYPAVEQLRSLVAQFVDLEPERIVISAGGDQAIERVIRRHVSAERPFVLMHQPSFEMIDIYSTNCGGHVRKVDWLVGEFPVDQFSHEIDRQTAVVVLVTPNNPTGQAIPAAGVLQIAERAREHGAILLVDLAYVEFADTDPTRELAVHPNIAIVRTFSKAYGLAGLRVGYLIAPDAASARHYWAQTGPFPVSGPSLELACQAIRCPQMMEQNIRQVIRERTEMTDLLVQCGARPIASQANFVLAEFDDAAQIWNDFGQAGIAIRKFTGPAFLKNKLRITCPANAADYLHLAKCLLTITGTNLDFGSPVLPLDEPVEPAHVAENIQPRTASVSRKTKETDIQIEVNLDGNGQTQIATGIGFLDHMLTALAFHARFDLKLQCRGDLHIDDHHTAEDCALALGSAIDQALGPRSGIVRFGYAYAPLDEALARTVIDLSGRPWPEIHLAFEREMIGSIATENITHVFNSLGMSLRCSLHVDVIRGTNDHHRAEAAFKSLALALRKAVARTAGEVPSTKGVI
jgi:histidinol-phosphate aminotransferase